MILLILIIYCVLPETRGELIFINKLVKLPKVQVEAIEQLHVDEAVAVT